MKKLTYILLFAILVPQIVSAAWWNPLSWKILRRADSKTQILENRVKELEQKLEAAPTTQATTTMKENTKPTKNSPVINTQTNTQSISSPIQQVQKNYESSYDDLVKKYTELLSVVESEKKLMRKNSPLQSEKGYYRYLEQLQTKANSDLGYLVSIKYYNPRPKGIVEIYSTKYIQLNNDYWANNKAYATEIKEEAYLYELQRPAREQQAKEEARKDSPECRAATTAYEAVKAEAKPLKEKENAWYNEYLTTGKYNNSSERSSVSSKLADLALRESGLMSEYYYVCEGFVPTPSKIYNTDCYYIGGTLRCSTY